MSALGQKRTLKVRLRCGHLKTLLGVSIRRLFPRLRKRFGALKI